MREVQAIESQDSDRRVPDFWRRHAAVASLGITKRLKLVVGFFAVFTWLSANLLAQSSGSIRYFHDDLGRLSRVVDQNGNSATYTYDAVGNILSITRSTVPANNGLAIFNFTPQSGSVGQSVTIQGQGFSATPASNSVQFNGTATTVASATSTALVVTIPTGATTGPISVSVSGSSANSDSAFTVTSPIASIAVSPSGLSFRPAGQQQQFTATATLNDGTHQDVTASVAWSSLNPSVAVVSNATGSKGLVTSVGNGTASIVATSGNVSGSTSMTVVPFSSVTVSPASATVQLGATEQFTASGTFSDGTKEDITTQVDWTTNPAVMTISNATGTQGLGTAVGIGPAEICAEPPGAILTSGCAGVNVPLVLNSIAISPQDSSIPKGVTQQFTAQGSYNNNTFQDLTSTVTWSSSDPTVATISNNSGSQGLVTDVGVGTTTITATYGSVTGSTTLTLTPAVPVSISVSPARLVLQLGNTVQLAANAVFTDDTKQDVTQTAVWSSTNTSVATVDAKGFLTTVGLGSTTIAAASGGMTGNATVIVTTATAIGLSRFGYVPNRDSTISIYTVNAGSGQFRANGYFRGQASGAQAIVLDPTSRFLYIANSSNTVSAYQVNSANGSLTEIAGSPFPAGNSPDALVIDPSGKFLYVANNYANTVSAFAIDTSSGALSEVGSPYPVGNFPVSLTIDPSGQLLYVANQNSNNVSAFTIDSSTGGLSDLAGSPFPAQTRPTAIFADPKGRFIYVANHGQGGGSSAELVVPGRTNERSAAAFAVSTLKNDSRAFPEFAFKSERRTKSGMTWEATGTTIAPFGVRELGNVLIASLDLNQPYAFGHGLANLQTTTIPVVGLPSLGSLGAGKLFAQVGTVTGPSISVFALDANGALTEIPGSPFAVPSAPTSIVADPTGSYVYDLEYNQISGFSVDQTSGTLAQLSDSPYAAEFNSVSLYMDPSGQFLYAEGNQDTQEFTINPASGSVAPFGAYPNRGGVGSAVSKGTNALAYVPQYAYVVSSGKTLSGVTGGANNISGYSIDPGSGSLTALSGSPFTEGLFPEVGTSNPLGQFLFITNDCSDLACSATTGSVSAYNISPANGALSLITGSPFMAGTEPKGIAVDPSGQFAYVANQQNNTISAYAVDQTMGTLTAIAGSPFPMPTGSSGVVALAVDPEGVSLYAADTRGNVWLYNLGASGTPQYQYQILSGLSGTQSIAADPMGRFLLVPDSVSNDVVVLGTSRTPYYFAPVSGSPFPTGQTPASVAVDPTGRFVYIANKGSSSISAYALDPVAGTLTAIPGSPFVTGANPASVSVDISGKFLYVANEGDNTVSSFSIDPVSGALTPLTGSPMPGGTAPVSVTTTGKIQ